MKKFQRHYVPPMREAQIKNLFEGKEPIKYKNKKVLTTKHAANILGKHITTISSIITHTAPPYSERLIDMVQNKDYFDISNGEVSHLFYSFDNNKEHIEFPCRAKSLRLFSQTGFQKLANYVRQPKTYEIVNKYYFQEDEVKDTAEIELNFENNENVKIEDSISEKQEEKTELAKTNGTNIQFFDKKEFGSLAVILIEGEPWFIGKEIAIILGYTDTDQAIRLHVDKEDKKTLSYTEIQTRKIYGFASPRGLTIINESGLYSLILSSHLPRAKEFKHWVTSEVLPQIRKTGEYSITPIKETTNKLDKYNEYDVMRLMVNNLEKQKLQLDTHEAKIEDIDKRIKKLESLAVHDKMTIETYAKLNQFSVNSNICDALDKMANSLSNLRGSLVDTVIDPLDGIKNIYSKEICEEVFKEHYNKIYSQVVE